jgi:hypothetical protein
VSGPSFVITAKMQYWQGRGTISGDAGHGTTWIIGGGTFTTTLHCLNGDACTVTIVVTGGGQSIGSVSVPFPIFGWQSLPESDGNRVGSGGCSVGFTDHTSGHPGNTNVWADLALNFPNRDSNYPRSGMNNYGLQDGDTAEIRLEAVNGVLRGTINDVDINVVLNGPISTSGGVDVSGSGEVIDGDTTILAKLVSPLSAFPAYSYSAATSLDWQGTTWKKMTVLNEGHFSASDFWQDFIKSTELT